ncbi:MAG: permease-like cell division protein FtsX [Bacilli bacterium]|nr:permease-like cell division protein FtsX [Bacilli bacterium]
MKVFRMIPRYIRDAFKSVFRNFSLSVASISCIIVTLMLVSVAIILTSNVNNFAEKVKGDVTVVTFINNDVTSEQLDELKKDVEKIKNVESVEIITKTQKRDEMAETSEVFKNVVSSWPDDKNPLADELIIKVKDLEQIGKTAKTIEEMEEVESVKYGEGMVEKLVHVFKVVQRSMMIVVVGLVVVTAFLITNTIKLTIFSRKREIEIMRLVGASNITVKFPFIVEGLVLGIIGSILPILGTIYGYKALYGYFGGQLFSPLVELVKPFPYVYSLSLVLLAIGALVGMFSSARAVRKYLKI